VNRSAVAYLIIALVVPSATAQPMPVEVPAEIKVPGGHKLVAQFEAKGVQVYKAVNGKDGGLVWEFEGPLADLFDQKGKKVGIHYGGPAWEAGDGSKVVKPKDKKPKSVEAKNPTKDLPWLLVPVIADEPKDGKPETLSRVVFIQRVSTSGGLPPKNAPKRRDSKIAVPYTAVYYFWANANLQLRDGKVVVTGEFTAADPINMTGNRFKSFTFQGEPGKLYSVTREGAASWVQPDFIRRAPPRCEST
jgi:hypothetical protein